MMLRFSSVICVRGRQKKCRHSGRGPKGREPESSKLRLVVTGFRARRSASRRGVPEWRL